MKIKSTKLLQILVISIILVSSSTTFTSGLTDNDNVPELETQQIEPNLIITSLFVSEDVITEGDLISVYIEIENLDNQSYLNFRVAVVLIEQVDGGHGGGEEGSETQLTMPPIIRIDPLTSITLEGSYLAVAGNYQIFGIVIYNNIELSSSTFTTNLTILQPNVGDNTTILIGLIGLFGIMIIGIAIQPVVDKIRLRKND